MVKIMDRLGHIITIKVCIEIDYHAERMRYRKENFRLGDSHRKDTAWAKLYTLAEGFEKKSLVSGPIFPNDSA